MHTLEGASHSCKAALARKALLAAFVLSASALPVLAQIKPCANPSGLGVSRVVEIDTTGGPGFGFEHYKAYDFLQPREVVLTFDDGPQKFHTEAVLAALANHCTKAIFFSIGKMALGYPEIIRRVASDGHTIGTHTWSHQRLRRAKTPAEAVDEIERGMSAVRRAVGGPIAPFFRFPALEDSPDTLSHLQSRNVAMFSTDIDSFDFKHQPPELLVKAIIDKLEKKGKGILLMHDIQPTTARAIPLLLATLKERGFKIVQMKAKGELKTLPEFDAAIEQNVKGLGVVGAERPTSSVVRTVESDQPSKLGGAEPAASAPAPANTEATKPNPGTPVENKAMVAQPSGTGGSAPLVRKWFWQN
jgi:peptidoglycan-N-acetylglucosamine deacetylase